MIVFYKVSLSTVNSGNKHQAVKVDRRVKVVKRKISKNNRLFLKAIGLKL